jgi:septum formation protein
LSHECLFEDVLKKKLVLASGSPRRAEILNAVGWPFEIVAANIDESRFESEAAVPYVSRLAKTKAETVAKNLPSGLVLGADTVVLVDDEILGQPSDAEDARRMLKLLSGRWHEVLTAVALLRAGDNRSVVDHEKTRVRFAEMSVAEIDWYVMTGEPMDKAGAYAVQGSAALFIEEIQGDYFNIVGLPVRLVYKLARKIQEV